MREAQDFEDECAAVAALLDDAPPALFTAPTLFRDWTVGDIIGHLHMWNHAADLTLQDRDAFVAFLSEAMKDYAQTHSTLPGQQKWLASHLPGMEGRALYEAWRDFYPRLAAHYAACDRDTRVAWAGPDMTAASKIIARQMETWSHAQAIFDLMGKDRREADRLKNIADLGVRTFGWAYRIRGRTPPAPKPFVSLTAPSGARWTWNEAQEDNVIAGLASEFCQVVTQTRNIGDTHLQITGAIGADWMSIAQCFAGGPATPPEKGHRRKSGQAMT